MNSDRAPASDAQAASVPMQPLSQPQLQQPQANQAMDPTRPHDDPELGLRGGHRGGMCPGRFCFCVPCPLPCDFCII